MPDTNEPKKAKKVFKLKMKDSLKPAGASDTPETAAQEAAPQQPQAQQPRPQTFTPKPRPAGQQSYNRPGGGRPNQQSSSRPGGQRSQQQQSSRPGGRPPFRSGQQSSSQTSTDSAQKDAASRTKRRTVHTQKPNEFIVKERSKSKNEEIVLSKMQSNLRNKQKRGEAVIPDEIEIGEVIKVADLAKRMNLKSGELIQKLMELGVMATINDNIDSDTAQIVCSEFSCKVVVKSIREQVEIKEEEDDPALLEPRPPIVTIMGHVDHGKTKLLDAIRNSNVAEHESGGITQHIGAYKVSTKQGEITFLDTPGHEAFTAMRARGAEVTDIVVLVVSAADGVMPQTLEALSHAQAAKVPIVVAVNKVDLPEANVERVKQQLAEQNLLPEEWGGQTQFIPVSALKKQGIDKLLEAILVQAEIMELKANPKKHAAGYVIESKMDIGKGALATVVVKNGCISVGDNFVVGTSMGKVRAMFDDKGTRVKKALPSDAVEIMGFNEVPEAGDRFFIVDSEEYAKDVASKRLELKKLEDSKTIKRLQMENAMQKLSLPAMKEFKVIVKADVQGSVEAIKHSLDKMVNNEIKVTILHAGVGTVVESDVLLASTSAMTSDVGVAILAFRVRVDSIAKDKSESEGIQIRRFSIIYELLDYVTSVIEGMLAPEVTETVIGAAEVKEVFKISGVGKIAGCMVTEGFIRKAENVRLFREDAQIWDGKISALKRFQDDVSEVQQGFECGISLKGYENMKKGDIIECYTSTSKERKFVPNDGSAAQPAEKTPELSPEPDTPADKSKKTRKKSGDK